MINKIQEHNKLVDRKGMLLAGVENGDYEIEDIFCELSEINLLLDKLSTEINNYYENVMHNKIYDERKYAHPFYRKFYKAMMSLGPDYQKMLDSTDHCSLGDCEACGDLRRICAMFDDIFTSLEYYNTEFKLDADELPEDYQ